MRVSYDLTSVNGEQILKYSAERVPLCNHCIKNEINRERCGKIPCLEESAERNWADIVGVVDSDVFKGGFG